jgi:hypothetical protein
VEEGVEEQLLVALCSSIPANTLSFDDGSKLDAHDVVRDRLQKLASGVFSISHASPITFLLCTIGWCWNVYGEET